MMGVAILIYGMIPKFTGFTWLYLLFSFIVVYLGNLFQFPAWVVNLSPYGLIPQIPVEDMDFMKIAIMTLIAIPLTTAGFIGYNKRDIQG
jgi:ABC-2 type transport system permease protein